jgi:hypothetical protein
MAIGLGRVCQPQTLISHPLDEYRDGAVFRLPAAGQKLNSPHRMWSLLKEFFKFARQEKKWWLIPLIVVLLLLGAMLIFTASSGIAWALYPFL